MAGYDFNVNPVQVGGGVGNGGYDYQARKDAAALRKQQLADNAIKLRQAQKAEADEKARSTAAASAYQPHSYTPPQTGINVGGADLGYQPATVQGPAQFNRGSYLNALPPDQRMQADQQFQQQDFEHQKQMASLAEQFSKTDQESLKAFNAGWDTLGRYLQVVDEAPEQMKPQIYAQALQHASENPAIAHLGIAQQAPPQYDPQSFQQMKSQFMDVKQAADLANARINQQITMRGQDMTASTAKAGQAVTVRGQNMVDARTKETQGSQVMEVPQPDGSVKLQRVKIGDTLPGGAQTVAAAQKTKEDATVDEKKKADLVTNAKENLAALRDIITRRPELFGPYAGRLTSLRAAAGTSDEDISKLAGIKDRFGMVNQGLHSMRSASHVAEAGDAVLNKMRNSPEATLAAIDEAEKSLETFQRPVAEQRGNLSGNAGGGGLQIVRDAQGRITGVK